MRVPRLLQRAPCHSARPKIPGVRQLALACAMISVMALTASGLQAQSVYRIVGPDGRVTFSDKPSLSAVPAAKGSAPDIPTTAPSASGVALPFELRRVVNQFPVTLYTASNCAPCDQGRLLLRKRGVPFAEKTVSSAEDAQALQTLSGNTSLPFLTIGSQQIQGFSEQEWTQYLTAAAYPETSKLPASYRAPAATPLVVPEQPAVAQDKPAPQAPRPAEVPVAPKRSTDNPAGIQF